MAVPGDAHVQVARKQPVHGAVQAGAGTVSVHEAGDATHQVVVGRLYVAGPLANLGGPVTRPERTEELHRLLVGENH